MKRLLTTLLLVAVVSLSAFAQGKFSGVFFGDYFYSAARDTAFRSADLSNAALKGPKSMQGFVIRRVYFTYDYAINEQFDTRFRLEVDGSNGPTKGTATVDGKYSVDVKDAWLKWKGVFKGSDLIFGIQPTQAYDVSEAAWAYRSLEKTIMDLRGIVSSRNLGVALRGKIDDKGIYNYWILVGNGGPKDVGNSPKDLSASLATGDKFNVYSILFHVKPDPTVQFTLYGDYRPTYNVNDPASTTAPPATVTNASYTAGGFVNYTQPDKFSVGVEGFLRGTADAYKDLTDPKTLKTQKTLGVSVWGWYNIDTSWSVVGRFDYFDPRTGSSLTAAEKGDSRDYILAAIVYKPAKNVQVMPNVQIETFEKIPNVRSVDASVTGRLTFAFGF
jgi:hypothetical protein